MTEFHSTLAERAAALNLRTRVAAAFGRSAARYDHYAALQRQVADGLLTKLPQQNFSTVLDLGCGTGYCAQQLQAKLPQAHLLALDVAVPMLLQARAQLESARLVCATAEALPLADASLDLVVSSLTLQWCDSAAVLAELQRVLRPGGMALISTLGPATLRELRAAWAVADDRRHGNEFADAAVLHDAAKHASLHLDFSSETLVRPYPSLLALSRELKGLGANVVASRSQSRSSPAAFRIAAAAFARHRQSDGIPVSWETYYLTLRKPA
ncbi:MAG TPA: malonyl-ACP O-methyltransferase BioC [Candidatus Acidoferrum sp.]|nr:malonyl-ACP O-methyltransferase BioC [Candidatus Acidoferrum sp.]